MKKSIQKILGVLSGVLSLCFFGSVIYLMVVLTGLGAVVGMLLLVPVIGNVFLHLFSQRGLRSLIYAYGACAAYILFLYISALYIAFKSQVYWDYWTIVVIILCMFHLCSIRWRVFSKARGM